MLAELIMNRPVISCRPTDTLNAAAGLMWEHDCGALPVVDENAVVVGMITDRDICMAAYTTGRSIQGTQVSEAMATHVFSCRPTHDIADAEATMARAQVRRLPVLDAEGRAIGIISMNDVARATATAGRKTVSETLATIAAISEPRRQALEQMHHPA